MGSLLQLGLQLHAWVLVCVWLGVPAAAAGAWGLGMPGGRIAGAPSISSRLQQSARTSASPLCPGSAVSAPSRITAYSRAPCRHLWTSRAILGIPILLRVQCERTVQYPVMGGQYCREVLKNISRVRLTVSAFCVLYCILFQTISKRTRPCWPYNYSSLLQYLPYYTYTLRAPYRLQRCTVL